jgi:hypothetical protein
MQANCEESGTVLTGHVELQVVLYKKYEGLQEEQFALVPSEQLAQ